MKVKELIEKLSEFDEDLDVGGSGFLGELLEIEGVWVVIDLEREIPLYVNIQIDHKDFNITEVDL